MFTLAKLYNINCDSISYRGRDKILEKEKKPKKEESFIFPPVWSVESFLTVDQDNWADFNRKFGNFTFFSS